MGTGDASDAPPKGNGAAVGVAVGVPLFSYLDARQELVGSDVDTARLLASLGTGCFYELSVEADCRLRLVHAGFVVPRNQPALETMGTGWKKVVPSLGAIADGQD